MPDATAAACSGCMAPDGSSAIIVTASLPARSLPAATPPSLRKSASFNAESLPAPITIRRETLRPCGARISSVDPLLPLNWLLSAARLTRLADEPSVLRVAHDKLTLRCQDSQ